MLGHLFFFLRDAEGERLGRRKTHAPSVSMWRTMVRILAQLPWEPSVRQGPGWHLRVWSQGSHLWSVGVSGNAVGDVLNGPSLLSSSGTCSCKTLSFAKELRGPKGCGDKSGAQPGKPSCTGKYWTSAGFLFQENPLPPSQNRAPLSYS